MEKDIASSSTSFVERKVVINVGVQCHPAVFNMMQNRTTVADFPIDAAIE